MSGHSLQQSSPQRARRSGANAPNAELAILTATEQLLAQTPLHDLSVAQIIDRAGVSRATFYFYFSSKFAVVAALVKLAIAEIYSVSRRTLHSPPGAARVAAIKQRIRDSAEVWDRHRPVLGATVENWHVYPELRGLWLEMLSGLTDAIASELQEMRTGVAHPVGSEVRAIASMLAWTTERCLYTLGIDGYLAPDERETRLDALTQVWLSMLDNGSASNRQAA